MGHLFAGVHFPPPYWDNLFSTACLLFLLQPHMNINRKKEKEHKKEKCGATQGEKWGSQKSMRDRGKKGGIVTQYRAMRWSKISVSLLNLLWHWYPLRTQLAAALPVQDNGDIVALVIVQLKGDCLQGYLAVYFIQRCVLSKSLYVPLPLELQELHNRQNPQVSLGL